MEATLTNMLLPIGLAGCGAILALSLWVVWEYWQMLRRGAARLLPVHVLLMATSYICLVLGGAFRLVGLGWRTEMSVGGAGLVLGCAGLLSLGLHQRSR